MLSNRYLAIVILLAAMQTACQTAPKVEPETTPAPQPQPEVKADPALELYELAISTAKAGQVNEAIDFFRQLIAIAAEYPLAHTNLGLLLLQQNQAADAKAEFLTAIEQDKKDAIAYNHLAIIERQDGLFNEAKAHYLEALQINPDYANAHLNLGILLDIYLQQLEDALTHYQKFQALTGGKDEAVTKWIADLERRIQKKADSKG